MYREGCCFPGTSSVASSHLPIGRPPAKGQLSLKLSSTPAKTWQWAPPPPSPSPSPLPSPLRARPLPPPCWHPIPSATLPSPPRSLPQPCRHPIPSAILPSPPRSLSPPCWQSTSRSTSSAVHPPTYRNAEPQQDTPHPQTRGRWARASGASPSLRPAPAADRTP